MISELYQKVLENELGRARYLLLLMVVGTWQILKQAKLEILAEALPIPILFESRRKKLKRFLKLEILNIEKIWFLCLKEMLKQQERFTIKGLVYIAIDRTSWGAIRQFKSELHHCPILFHRIPRIGFDSQDIFEDDC